jgi:hypothetical protein
VTTKQKKIAMTSVIHRMAMMAYLKVIFRLRDRVALGLGVSQNNVF